MSLVSGNHSNTHMYPLAASDEIVTVFRCVSTTILDITDAPFATGYTFTQFNPLPPPPTRGYSPTHDKAVSHRDTSLINEFCKDVKCAARKWTPSRTLNNRIPSVFGL